MTRIEFHVAGVPVPQGSTRAFVLKPKGGKPKAILTNDETGSLAKWRADVRDAAGKALSPSRELITDVVSLSVTWWFSRPKSHYLPVTKSRPEPVLRDDAPEYCDTRGDLDKHLRAVKDALSLVVYDDDKRVVRLGLCELRWGRFAGADIVVSEILP